MTTLLILSVGSLVGTNILDAVQAFRPGLRVIGLNSDAAAPNNFRCDRVWLAPPAQQAPAYWQHVEQVLLAEQPDLVLAGRDDDIPLLAEWREQHPRWARCLSAGPLAMAAPMTDKLLGHRWALERGLPFAPTVAADDAAAPAQCRRWRSDHDGALIAKPRSGNGSRGVRLLLDEAAVAATLGDPTLVIQPYLADAAPYRRLLQQQRDGTVPLFWTPVLHQHVAQAVIGPDGDLLGRMEMSARMVAGRCEQAQWLNDPDFSALSARCAQAFAEGGWVGPVNAQFIHHPRFGYQIMEFCARIAGGMHPRLLLGFDEMGLLLSAWSGRPAAFVRPQLQRHHDVLRVTRDVALPAAAVATLQAEGTWAAGC